MRYVFFFLLIASGALAADRPNILFLFSDDHAIKAISAYGGPLAKVAPTPHIDRLAKEGSVFLNSFCANSICGPSRATILTGKHSHKNGFMRNGNKFNPDQWTVAKELQKGGYHTAVIGKWHLNTTPQGFDYWEVLPGQGSYYNPVFIQQDNSRKRFEGYATDITTDKAIAWLDSRKGANKKKPFFLMCQHKAPHGRWEPALRHLNTFEETAIPEPPTLFDYYDGRSAASANHKMGIADDMGPHRLMFRYSSKFTPEQFKVFDGHFRPRNEALEKLNLRGRDRTRWNYQRYIKNYLRCVKAVDENVGRMLKFLDDSGLAKDTIVIYSSDQGFWLGEHGWFDKRWMYEESLHTPLLVRWPGVTKAGSTNDALVSNLDFSQTFLDIAGAKIPGDMQGRSLTPLLRGKAPANWRKTHYYHYYEAGGHGVPIHYGVTNGRFKLIRFPDEKLNTWEFFDLKTDPMEMTSRYDDPKYKQPIADLKKELDRLRRKYLIRESN